MVKLLPVLRKNLSTTHMAQGHHLLWSFVICALISFIYSVLFFLSMKLLLLHCLYSHLLLDITLFPISISFASFGFFPIASSSFVFLFISSMMFFTPNFCCYFSYSCVVSPTLLCSVFLLHLLRHHFIFCFSSLRRQSSPF